MNATRVVRLELHCHTHFSKDGLMDFEALLGTAEKVGLDALAITDHDTVEGALAFQQRAAREQRPVTIIAGEERTLEDGSHLIGLFLREAIASTNLREAIAEIRGQGGFCLIPHPFRRKDGLLRDGAGVLEEFRGGPVGFEIFNGKGSGADNRKAQEFLPAGMGPFGGSDAHYDSDLGESVNVVEWQGDWKGTVEALLTRSAPLRIMGKAQALSDGERAYAPLYYRLRKFVRLPRPWVPGAKAVYRRYRNWRYGVGKKQLREIYVHP